MKIIERIIRRARLVPEDISRIGNWERRNLASNSLFLIICICVGFLSGTGAWLLKLLIKWVSLLLTTGLSPVSFNWRFLILPLAGILLTGIFTRYIIRRDISKGVGKVREDLSTKHYKLSPSLMWTNIFGSTITLGFGGSAGSEAPIAYTGAAVGSNIGRLFNMPPEKLRMLVGIGAGAGIAGIFKAPVGGLLFTLEVLELEMTTFSVLAMALACIVSALTCFAFSGFQPDVRFFDIQPFDPHFLWWMIPLGIFCGLYSVYYNYLKRKTDKMLLRMGNPWVKNISAGIILSVGVFLFPAFYGEGYGIATDLINGQFYKLVDFSLFEQYEGAVYVLPLCALGILLLKSALVSCATSGGGVAGDFAPTLFSGAVAGFLFSYTLNHLFGVELPACNFALAGMAAVMAGTIHAPLMAIFIVVEMSQGYTFFMPVCIAAIISYVIMKIITPRTWFSDTRHDDILSLRKKQ